MNGSMVRRMLQGLHQIQHLRLNYLQGQVTLGQRQVANSDQVMTLDPYQAANSDRVMTLGQCQVANSDRVMTLGQRQVANSDQVILDQHQPLNRSQHQLALMLF